MATISSSDGSAAVAKLPDGSTSSTPPATAAQSCRRKKSEGASFVQDIRDHFDEFVHASMDEHRACFKNTLNKMFKSSKKTESKSELPPAPAVESVLPLSSTTSS